MEFRNLQLERGYWVVNKEKLMYQQNGWKELPAWCKFYLELGQWIRKVNTRDNLVIILSVPVRLFVASFIAAGYVSVRKNSQVDYDDYFRKLCSLPVGTPLLFMDNGRKKVAILKGTEVVLGQERIKVQVENDESGGLTHMLLPEQTGNLLLADMAEVSLPANQKGRQLPVNQDFIKEFLGVNDITNYVIQAELECLIVGQIAALREELTVQQFGFTKRGKYIKGKLQDIVMAKKFASNTIGYHCDIVAATKSLENPQCELAVPLVIFDGPTAFLNAGSVVKARVKVMVLDRIGRDYPEAVRQLNQRFFQSKKREVDIQVNQDIPPGVFLMTFEEGEK